MNTNDILGEIQHYICQRHNLRINYFDWMLHIKNLKLSQTRAGLDLSFPSSIWSQKSSRLLRYVKALWASAAILLSTRLPWVVPWPGCFRLSPRARTAKYTLSSKRRSVTICFFCVRVLSFAFVLAAFNAFLANTLVSLAWLLWWAKTFAFWALTCLDLEKEQNCKHSSVCLAGFFFTDFC